LTPGYRARGWQPRHGGDASGAKSIAGRTNRGVAFAATAGWQRTPRLGWLTITGQRPWGRVVT
jgi:hypothetical protein